MLRVTASPGPLRSSLVSCACLLRGVPLFFCAAPRTPLRVLCIVALDTIQMLRGWPPLSRRRRNDLAAFLDFQACTNMVWDRKPFCAIAYAELQRQLEKAGLGRWVTEYLHRLGALETRRPSPGGDVHRCAEVRSYREAVARLSLATIAAIATNAAGIDEGIEATYRDRDIAILLRLAMQCQIVDDVIDYRTDLRAGLPTFLTASASLDDALASTAHAARSYGGRRRRSAERSALPFEVALTVLTAVTHLLVLAPAARRRQQPCAASGDSW